MRSTPLDPFSTRRDGSDGHRGRSVVRMAHADDPWRVADEGTQQAAGSGVIERDLEPGCRLRAKDQPLLDPEDPAVAWVEYPGGAVYVEETQYVEAFILNFDGLTQRFLCPAESAKLIREIAEG